MVLFLGKARNHLSLHGAIVGKASKFTSQGSPEAWLLLLLGLFKAVLSLNLVLGLIQAPFLENRLD